MSDFNHDAEDMFEAIGTTKKDFEQQVGTVNDAVRLAKPTKISQEVEILIGKLSPKELALLFIMTKRGLETLTTLMQLKSESSGGLEDLIKQIKAEKDGGDTDTPKEEEGGSFS